MSNRTLAMGMLVMTGVAGTICARAADMPALFPAPAYQDAEPPPQMEYGTGWYLRGDLTASNDVVPTMLGTLAGSSIKHEWNLGAGGGIGYKFTDYFRADVTGDYLSTERRSATDAATGITSRASLDRWTGLINGYVDIGNWSGFTPYIGAGVGVAGLTASGSFTTINGVQVKTGSQDDYQLAWAAMAGVAYHVSPHLMLDIGYRYLDLGTYKAPQSTDTQRTVFNTNKTDLTSHEIRVGVRYQID